MGGVREGLLGKVTFEPRLKQVWEEPPVEICWGSIPGCGNRQCKGPEVGLPAGQYSRKVGGDEVSRCWGRVGAQEGSEQREGCGGAIPVLLDLVLGKLRALTFDFQLYLDFLSEWYSPSHRGAQCRFSFDKNQLPMGLYHLQLHFHLVFGAVSLQETWPHQAAAWHTVGAGWIPVR